MPLDYRPDRRQGRRVMRLSLGVDMFLRILQDMDGLKRIRCNGLPEDARCVGILTDIMYNTVILVLESAVFEEVPEGNVSPELYLDFTEYSGNLVPDTA